MLSANINANAIVPLTLVDNSSTSPQVSTIFTQRLTFLQAFGRLGVPMVFVAIMAISWTIWLVILTINPNATANFLMDTSKFDDGSFWLIIYPEPVLMAFSVCGLTIVALGYVHVLATMTIWRQSHVKWVVSKKNEAWIQQMWSHSSLKKVADSSRILPMWIELTGFQGRYRKFWVRPLCSALNTIQSIYCRLFPRIYASKWSI